MTRSSRPRVAIVGAGPAGIRAAETLAAAGLVPIVIDEAARAGGQIYRRPPEGFTRLPGTLYGSEAHKAVALHATFDDLALTGRLMHRPRSSVMAIADKHLQVLGPEGCDWLRYDRLILATGAMDRIAPVPGWESPGVYSLGAMQIALKAQGVAMGRHIVLAGSGPLLTLLATQLLKTGAGLVAVLDTATFRQQATGLPGLMARPGLALRGLGMRACLGRLYRTGVTIERIEVDEGGPTALLWRDRAGRAHRTFCDAVGLGWHLRSETQLADLAGCRFDYSTTWHQWLPRADAAGRAGEGVYLAGDGLRILGADGAEVSGRLAAASCLADLELPAPDITADLRELDRITRFASGIARAFPWPARMVRDMADDTIVCRCECITAGALRESAIYGGAEVNRTKSLGRVGMGRCQGRYCELSGAELVAARGGLSSSAEAGRLRGQAPVRPAPIGAFLTDHASSAPSGD